MKTKIKIFQHFINKPKEVETMIQEWLDTFEKNGQNIEINHVSHIAVDGQLVQTMIIYREVPVAKQLQT